MLDVKTLQTSMGQHFIYTFILFYANTENIAGVEIVNN